MKRYIVTGLLTLGLVAGGLVPRASAQVEDVEVIAGNLPAAGSALVSGLQEALDTLTSTQSAVDTSAATGDALVAGGSALVAGAPQFGALGLGFLLINGAVQGALEPYLVLIDDQAPIFEALEDPSAIGEVFDVNDIGTLLGNLPDVPEALIEAPQIGTGLRGALIGLLEGDLAVATEGALGGVLDAGLTLLQGTNYAPLMQPVGIAAIVVLLGTAGQIAEAEEALAPLFEATGEATAPLVELLEGISL